MDSLINWLKRNQWITTALAVLAGIAYLYQSWGYAHTLRPNLDEGAYLYKGFLFVSGKYTLYQDYGPWTNHLPLAFLIPGAIQVLFGPGLDVGRFFMIILGGLNLLGLWILAKRLGGCWWATAVVVVYTLNPAIIKMYSTAISQGIIACMFTWVLVLVLGEKRPLWQIILGSILAGLLFMTRINMLPLLPLVVLYIYWQFGSRYGNLALLSCAATVAIGHALYWPGILQVWARLIPRSLPPQFLDIWRLPPGYKKISGSEITTYTQWLSFFHTIRFHFTSVVGVLFAWMLFPRNKDWRSPGDFRIAIFLSVIFLGFSLLHAWASLTQDYCVLCLPGYFAFFSMTGVLLVVITIPCWRRRLSIGNQVVIALLILAISAGIGIGAFEDTITGILDINIPRFLFELPKFSPGFVKLGAALANKFSLGHPELRRLNPTLTGLGGGFVLLSLSLGWDIYYRKTKRALKNIQLKAPPSYGYWAAIIFLLAGTLLSPITYLGGGKSQYDCGGDILQSYRIVGEHLAHTVPPGSIVYWEGGSPAIPLLYIPGITIFPPQINDGFNYFIKGDSNALQKLGYWNPTLSRHWLQEADFALVERKIFKNFPDYKHDVMESFYTRVGITPPKEACIKDSEIIIFEKLP